MHARNRKFQIIFGCYTNAEQNCITLLKDSGKLIQAHYTQHSRGLCFNGNSNFSILSSREKKSVVIFTISFSPSHLYNQDPWLILSKILPSLPTITIQVPQAAEELYPLREVWLHFLFSSSCFLLKQFPDLTVCSSQKASNYNFGFFLSQQHL